MGLMAGDWRCAAAAPGIWLPVHTKRRKKAYGDTGAGTLTCLCTLLEMGINCR
jgi:hypothetical protein